MNIIRKLSVKKIIECVAVKEATWSFLILLKITELFEANIVAMKTRIPATRLSSSYCEEVFTTSPNMSNIYALL